jgi:hypothetical protein
MPASPAFTLTGIAIENATATITISPRTPHADGMDMAVSVRLLEYTFEVETFYYGYNFELFLREAEDVSAGHARRTHLFNYDQTLVLEFISHEGITFLSLDYHSILPQPPDDNVLRALRTTSRSDSTTTTGSRFSTSFMPLHNPLSQITDWLSGVLAKYPMSKENPYPH